MPLVPCVVCGREIEVKPWLGVNKVFYQPEQKLYACCSDRDCCVGLPEELDARIEAIPQDRRRRSEAPR